MAKTKKAAKRRMGAPTNGTIQKSFRFKSTDWADLKALSELINEDRDPIESQMKPTQLVHIAIRDLLKKHEETGSYAGDWRER